jgi:hypothetical protein
MRGEAMNLLLETVDRLRRDENSSRPAWIVLAVAMPISALLALWFGRHAWFSVDELAWISASPNLDLGGAFAAHVGHLVLVPRLVYKLVFETVGPEYVVFRMLTATSVLLTAALFFVWAKRRLPDFVALAGALVVLFFPADALHFIGGNGFTIMFALACGLAALIAFDRDDVPGDIAAFAFLMLGIATYTVALPFAVGLIVAALLEKSATRRLWVGLAPILLYLLWRLLAGVGGSDPEAGGADPGNLVLMPSWTFQALGAVLTAWSGLNFDFSTGGSLPPGSGPGPALALAALVALGWRISRGDMRPLFWAAIATAAALFAAQTLSWGAILRGPELPRYLYPGLIVVLLVAVEATRGLRWSRGAFVGLWLVTVVCLLSGFGLLREVSDWYKDRGEQMRAEVTAVSLLESTGRAPAPRLQPRDKLSDEFRPGPAAEYGYLGYRTSSLPARVAGSVDRFLAKSLSLELVPLPSAVRVTGCRSAVKHGDNFRLYLPPDGAVIRSAAVAKLRLGRFGPGRIDLGLVGPGSEHLLRLYPDSNPTPWFVATDQPGLTACTLAGRGR